MRYVRFDVHEIRSDPRLGRWYERLSGQPSWVWKVATAAALLVVVLPILLLAAAAAVTFLVLFIVLGAAYRVGRWVRSALGGSGQRDDDVVRRPDGRTVRVIRTDSR